MDEHFNSSDIEFEPVPDKTGPPRGQASIAKIIEQAELYRISSKKTVKQLQYGHGATRTREIQQTWVQRFNAFRTASLKQSLEDPFVGDDVIRFFDVIIGIIKPGEKDKPAPNSSIIVGGKEILVDYGIFTYPKSSGFEWTDRDKKRFDTWLDDAVRAGRLVKGVWRKRVWLGFTIISRMVQTWLEHHHDYGTWSWDVIISRTMSIVLIASLGSRVGDVARSDLYEGMECMQYRHVELMVAGDGKPLLENLKARIVVEYAKNKKETEGDDTEFFLSPLDNHYHMCPIRWILIHALRHGLVKGSNIQEVLQHATDAVDSKVVWLFPNRPVLACFTTRSTRELDLDEPAGIQQVHMSIKAMGIVSNILTPVHAHALRYGAARDVAHLESPDGMGFTTNQVRQTLNHSNTSMSKGVTERYIGPHTRETYNARAARPFESDWDVKFSEESALEVVNAPITDEDILEWQSLNEPDIIDPTSRASRDRARRYIRQSRHEKFITTAPPEKKKRQETNTSDKDTLASRSASEINAKHPVRNKRKLETKPKTAVAEAQDKGPAVAENDSRDGNPRLLDEDALENMEIDPADWLLGEDALENMETEPADLDALEDDALENMEIDPADLDALEEVINGTNTSKASAVEEPDAMVRAIFEDFDLCVNEQESNTVDSFIVKYCTINIVQKKFFGIEWIRYQKGTPFEDSIGLHSVSGNSRDPPTPFEYHCSKTPGCPFVHVLANRLVTHELFCTEKYAERVFRERNYKCSWDGCTKTYTRQDDLTKHIKYMHTFEPQACAEGCDPTKIYKSLATLTSHMQTKHSGRWPAACLFPYCTEEKTFASQSAYSRHLAKVHGLTEAERIPYFPPLPEKLMVRVWKESGCPFIGCERSTFAYKYKHDLANHIHRKHDVEKKTANEMAGCGYVMIPNTEHAPKGGNGVKKVSDNVDDDSGSDFLPEPKRTRTVKRASGDVDDGLPKVKKGKKGKKRTA